MNTRRRFLLSIGAVSSAAVAGCQTQADDSTPETDTSTPTEEETATPDQSVDGQELYEEWVYGEDDEFLEEARNEISIQEVRNKLEGDGSRVERVADAVMTANSMYRGGVYEDDPDHRHKLALSATLQAIQQTDEDINITTITDNAKTSAYGALDDFEYSKLWVEGEDQDINLSLEKEEYHIEGTDAPTKQENPAKNALKSIRDNDFTGDLSPHDYQTLHNDIEDYEERHGEHSDEKLEEIHGSFLEQFDYIWGEGTALPKTVEDWSEFGQAFETSGKAVRALNKAYRSSEYGENNEIAQFTMEDGSVTMSDLPDDHNISEEGITNNPAA